MPELCFGVFVTANSGSGQMSVLRLPELVTRHLFPPRADSGPGTEAGRMHEDTSRFDGRYMTNRRSFSGLEKLWLLYQPLVQIRSDDDGRLIMRTDDVELWEQVRPLLFRKAGGSEKIQFQQDDDGTILRFVHQLGHTSYERVGFADSPDFLRLSLGALLFMSVLTIVAYAARAIRSRAVFSAHGTLVRRLPVLELAAACGGIALCTTLGMALNRFRQGGLMYDFPPASLTAAVAASVLVSVLVLLLVAAMPAVWTETLWSIRSKIRFSLLALSGSTAVVALWKWNLLSPLTG